jgi:uncharacterized coiled-coil DUF342 family protein
LEKKLNDLIKSYKEGNLSRDYFNKQASEVRNEINSLRRKQDRITKKYQQNNKI